ncbi:MAG TPA: hypothetical protein VGJ20_36210 [Xanthobacteraceae bacterium]
MTSVYDKKASTLLVKADVGSGDTGVRREGQATFLCHTPAHVLDQVADRSDNWWRITVG